MLPVDAAMHHLVSLIQVFMVLIVPQTYVPCPATARHIHHY